MEYPYGHHHHRRDEDDAPPFPPPGSDPYAQPGYAAPPPPAYGGGRYGAEEPPYRPPVEHVAHDSYGGGGGYRPAVEHVAHDSYGGGGGYGREDPPYRPPVEHVAHDSYGGGGGYGRVDPPYRPPVEHVAHDSYGGGYGREEPPRRSAVEHVAHDGYGGGGGYGREEPPHRPAEEGYGREEKHHFPHFHHHHSPPVEHVAHESYGGGGSANQQPTVRVLTKAREDFSLSVREGKIVLVPSNPRDEYQHWIKDMRYSTKVKDEEGLPSFALVNKVTGEAIKHAVQQSHPVRLAPYNPEYLDESVLWTESKDTGEGFRCIRMVNNIRLNFDAFHGDEDHGGVRDGTTVVLWEWTKGKNQRWKVIPY